MSVKEFIPSEDGIGPDGNRYSAIQTNPSPAYANYFDTIAVGSDGPDVWVQIGGLDGMVAGMIDRDGGCRFAYMSVDEAHGFALALLDHIRKARESGQ